MKNEKKKIILEEYSSDFEYKNSKTNLIISFNRASFILFVFFIISIIFSLKVIYLGFKDKNDNNIFSKKSNFRSTIVDRNKNIIAKSVLTTNIGIDPKLVSNKEKLLLNLRIIFPNKNFIEISDKLNSKKFFYLEKKITSEKYEKVLLLGEKSIIEEQKITRIYPQENLYSHILGQIDNDNNGLSGIEKSFDERLKKSNNNLVLTVDSNLQYLIREQLILYNQIFDSKGSAAILMNIKNGEILSMLSLPDYDLNKRQQLSDDILINRSTKGIYEFGSVFKTFTLAAALDEGILKTDTIFQDLEKKIWCAGNPISEYDDEIPSTLTSEEILIRSGNIGSVRIAQKLGIEKYKNFLNALGLTKRIEFDIHEVGNPAKLQWGKCKLATTSFGHGISTTLIQLAKAYAIISNGGLSINPTLIINSDNNSNNRILRKKVSDQMNNILRKIVSTKEGTASFANIPGYEVGGKTGTAQKVINGVYTNEKVNTFASIFPTSDPKFVLAILLDEPKPNKEYVYNYKDGSGWKYKGNWRNTAGWTTVEVAGKIIEKIGPILATKY